MVMMKWLIIFVLLLSSFVVADYVVEQQVPDGTYACSSPLYSNQVCSFTIQEPLICIDQNNKTKTCDTSWEQNYKLINVTKHTKEKSLTQNVFNGYKVLSMTGNESKLFDVNITTNVEGKDYTICLEDKMPIKTVEECVNETICKDVTYKLPPTVSIYEEGRVLKESLSKEVGDRYCTNIDNPLELLWMKFGEESIVIEGDTSYNSTDVNVTQEPGFAHLQVNNTEEVLVHMPFHLDTTTVRDYSDSDNDGTIVGSVVWKSNEGRDGTGSYDFQGSNDYIRITNGVSTYINKTVTVNIWVKRDNPNGNAQTYIAKGYMFSSSENWYRASYGLAQHAGTIYWDIYTQQGGARARNPVTFADASTNWQMITGTFDGTTKNASLYIDGVFKASVITTYNGLNQNTENLYIGSESPGHGLAEFDGHMDDVTIFNRTLSTQEIIELYNSNYTLYKPNGTMYFAPQGIDLSLGNGSVNVSIANCVALNNTNLKVKVTDGNFVEMNSCDANVKGGADLDKSNVTFMFNRDASQFFTPIIEGNITLTALNGKPTHSTPVLNTTSSSQNDTNTNLTAWNQSTSDDTAIVKNIYNWKVNGTPIAVLNMPFEAINGTASDNSHDYSGFGNDGTSSGDPAWNSSGGFDGRGGYNFDGNDHFEISSSSNLQMIDNFTLMAWAKPNGASEDGYFIQKGAATEWGMYLQGSTDELFFFPGAVKSNAVFVDNSDWVHATIVVENKIATFYRNGVPAGSGAVSPTISTGAVRIGNRVGGTVAGTYFNGNLDEIYVFNRSLSAEQIWNLYQNKSNEMHSNETTIGNNWSVEITPNDGVEDGAVKESNSLLIIENITGGPVAQPLDCGYRVVRNRTTGNVVWWKNCNGDMWVNKVWMQNNLNTTGNVTARYFIGNGSQLTDLTESQIVNYQANSSTDFLPILDIQISGNNTYWTTNNVTVTTKIDEQDHTKLNLSGGTLTGELNMGGNNITNINQLSAPDGSSIQAGLDDVFTDFDQAIVIKSNQTLGAGVVTHAIVDRIGVRVMALWQSGKNNSAGFWGNSMMIMPNNISTNGSVLSGCIFMANILGKTLRVGCDTSETGADLIVHDSIQAFGNIFADKGIRINGTADFIMGEHDFNVIGNQHTRKMRLEEQGFSDNDEVILFMQDFENGELSPFKLLTTSGDPDEWEETNNPLCFDELCARASSISLGTGTDTIIQANFSSLLFDTINVTFRLNTVNLDATVDYFNVSISNNTVGEQAIELFSITNGSDDARLINVVFPVSMNNKATLSLEYTCHVNLANEECTIDDVLVVGSATASTTVNVTKVDGLLKLGEKNILYNDSTGRFHLDTNLTIGEPGVVGEIKVRDTDDAGWSCLTTLNGVVSWGIC